MFIHLGWTKGSMTIPTRRLFRYGLALLTAVVAVGCKDDGDIIDPGATLALNPTGASVAQGGNTTTTATLTRSGDFTGSVTLSVTGAPSGVTATVSNIQTTGAVTTATVTVTVGLAVPAGSYELVVTATQSGVPTHQRTFTLTVTGLPAGVTAAFAPNPATGNSSVLTLTVGAAVPAQVYT